jgi:hypothetical protein
MAKNIDVILDTRDCGFLINIHINRARGYSWVFSRYYEIENRPLYSGLNCIF